MPIRLLPNLRGNLSKVLAVLWLNCVGFSLTVSASALLDNLQPGHWVEVPNSRLRDVAPSPLPSGNSGLDGLTAAWSGGAFDTTRNRLMIWGGGHADYSGNEIYGFDVDTLSWGVIEQNTPVNQIPTVNDPTTETYPDGKPAARHTYDGLVYLPDQDALWNQGGSLAWGGDATWGTWQYDLSLGQWAQKANAHSGFASTYGVNAQFDPVTDKVIWRDSFQGLSQIKEFDPVTNVWTQTFTGDAPLSNDSTTSTLDPTRRTVVFMGKSNYTGPQFFSYHIDTHVFSEPATTGDTEILAATAPGVAFDPISDKIVAWKGGSDVYSLDQDTLVWTRIAADPANTVTPTNATVTGTYGRWQYVPSEDAFIVYNDVDDNVFFYRLPSEGIEGDFDADADVDGNDFLVWQRDPGVGDLAHWQSNYGLSGGLAAAASVPEPSSLALLLLGLLGVIRRRV